MSSPPRLPGPKSLLYHNLHPQVGVEGDALGVLEDPKALIGSRRRWRCHEDAQIRFFIRRSPRNGDAGERCHRLAADKSEYVSVTPSTGADVAYAPGLGEHLPRGDNSVVRNRDVRDVLVLVRAVSAGRNGGRKCRRWNSRRRRGGRNNNSSRYRGRSHRGANSG